jgi:hypothetical protein
MNVIKFDIEIKKGWYFPDKTKSVKEQIIDSFKNELEFEGDFNLRLQNEWTNIQLEQVKALNSPNLLVGYVTSMNIKIFLFEKNNTGLRGKNNIALEVISFGDLPVDQILNESFSKIQKTNKNLSCNHINDTRIFIFPFDTATRDIYNYELKIRAELKRPYNITRSDSIRWLIMFLVATTSLILYFNLNSNTVATEDKESKDTLLNIYFSIFGSALFYLISDGIIYFLIPFFRKRNYRKIEITNLSSVVEARIESPMQSDEPLIIPEL